MSSPLALIVIEPSPFTVDEPAIDGVPTSTPVKVAAVALPARVNKQAVEVKSLFSFMDFLGFTRCVSPVLVLVKSCPGRPAALDPARSVPAQRPKRIADTGIIGTLCTLWSNEIKFVKR